MSKSESEERGPRPLIGEVFPGFAQELEELLRKGDELGLAAQVHQLEIVDRCRCGDEFCATFYTLARRKGRYASTHRSVSLPPERGMIILDVVEERIACVEALFRDEIRVKLRALLP